VPLATAPPPRRLLALCADDHGATPACSAVITELAQRGRLSAVSCLTNGRHWPGASARLSELPRAVERGLHFNLTEGSPLSAELARVWPRLPPLPRLIVLAHARRLPLPALACEWRAQWRAFVDARGDPPDFVDGHQHVHHLPGVREIVVGALAGRAPAVPVRSTGHVLGPGDALKRRLIERTGGAALQGLLRRRGVPHNAVLLGVYGFDDVDYRGRFRAWLRSVPPDGGALLFCHPGPADEEPDDPIAPARRREAAYLGSDAFVDDLAEAGVSLGPAWRRTSSAD
jgi:predicted glycoside hydrolase/deacetylase ChbG (UPF0249 family)